MSRIEIDAEKAEEFLNDLANEEVEELVALVAGLDRLEIKDGAPRYTEPQIDLIGRFDDFVNNRTP